MSSKKTILESKTITPELSKGEQTRAKLLEAAHELFLRQGFHGTSMRQIADRAGLAVGGIYNHFQDKEEIFAAVLDAYHPYHTLFPALEATQGETVEAFIRNAAQRVKSEIAGVETRLLPLIFMDLIEFQGRHLRQLAERIIPRALVFFQRFMKLPGDLRDYPPPVLIRTMVGMVLGYLLTEMVFKEVGLFKQSRYDWFGNTIDIYLYGILKAPTQNTSEG
jgi:AcrR family transcriptional regulator